MRSSERYPDQNGDPEPGSTVWWVDEGAPTLEVPVVAPAHPAQGPGPLPGRIVGATVLLGDRVGAIAERLLRGVLAVVTAVFMTLGAFWAVPWAEVGNTIALMADAADSLRAAAGEATSLTPTVPGTPAPDPGALNQSSDRAQPSTSVPDADAHEANPVDGSTGLVDDRPDHDPAADQLPLPDAQDGAAGASNPTQGEVNQAEVDRLQLGMTIDEVTHIVGIDGWDFELGFDTGLVMPSEPALVQLQHADTDLSRWALRQWPVEQFGPAFARVVFRDGTAVEIDRS